MSPALLAALPALSDIVRVRTSGRLGWALFSFGSPMVMGVSEAQVAAGNCRFVTTLLTGMPGGILAQLPGTAPAVLFETMVLRSRVTAVPLPICSVKMPPPPFAAVATLPSIVTLTSRISREGENCPNV